jgi:glutathione S-transferase
MNEGQADTGGPIVPKRKDAPMLLYSSPATPFGRKVMVTILETGLQDRVEVVTASGHALATGTIPIDQNPLGKIPVLLRDDGMALYDSRVICRYLDDLAGAELYGQGEALWHTLVLEATADGILDAALLMVYEGRVRPADKQFPDWVEGQWAKVTRSLDLLEGRDLTGMGMGHLALACALSYLDFRHGPRNWRDGRPALTAWEATIALRPSLQATRPVG